MANNIDNNKDNQAINDTQLDISANEQGLHLELEIPWKRIPLIAKISGFVLSHLMTIGVTLVNLPSLPHIPDSPAPQVEKLDCPSNQYLAINDLD
ncbi:MAG: hypothetical protein RLZZ139_625 [Cyanobacteriota bacterium]